MKIQKIKAPIKNNPLIPKNPADPAGQMVTVNRLLRDLKRRFNNINVKMKELVKSQRQIQKLVTNKAYYEYQLDVARLDSINDYILRLLRNELLESISGQQPFNWFYRSYLEQSFLDGINDAIYSAQNMSDPDIVGTYIAEQVANLNTDMINPQQSQRLALVYSRVFNEMQGLTDGMKVDLAETLTRGMDRGFGIAAITRDIAKRVQVGFSRAQRIARTEILGAYRTATRSEQDALNENVYADSEWQMQLLWWSALTSTTRPWHAALHGEIKTKQWIDEFYSEKGNSINCYCSQNLILVNVKTGEVVQQDLLDRMKAQFNVWRVGMKKAA